VIRGRFAPSPTGDLHAGGARTALVAWLQARSSGGAFVVRVEDLDRPRVADGAEARILDDLRWLGLDWDEGPDVGGPYGPYRQSERAERYQAAVADLRERGLAFPCFCSRTEVARAAQAPHGPADDGPRYPGTCRTLSYDEVCIRTAARNPSVRMRVEPGDVAWADAVHGRRYENVADTVGDFVLHRTDDVPAYQLAVVVDDAAMGITDVVRGDDLLPSTARQILLYRALGLPLPRFAHVPLLLGPDGERLAKRHGPISVRTWRERGVGPGHFVGWMAATLGLCPPDANVQPRELVATFSLSLLPRSATVMPAELLR
jgi:glutamyl-tRNA synthetase